MTNTPQYLAARAEAILIDRRNQDRAAMAATEHLSAYIHELANRADDAERRLCAVRACKVWTDDLGRDYVFCDELWHATDPEFNPEPKPIRLDPEGTEV